MACKVIKAPGGAFGVYGAFYFYIEGSNRPEAVAHRKVTNGGSKLGADCSLVTYSVNRTTLKAVLSSDIDYDIAVFQGVKWVFR